MSKDLTYLVFSEGLKLFLDNHLVEASNAFRRAHKESPGNPQYLSYYGLTVALIEKDIPRAIGLCKAAVEHAPYDPELYVNLCRVYREAGQRLKALDTLRTGLGFDSNSRILLMELRRMGIRRSPFLSLLGRNHLLNRIIGKLTYKFRKGASPSKGVRK